MRVETGGRDLAVWRARDNTVHCVDNRCPHRGMRLSFGFVRGNRLNCIYHGWQYGVDGACQYIPAHPELTPPASLCVPTLDCDEGNGLVWIALNPTTSRIAATADHLPLRSIVINLEVGVLAKMLQSGALPATTHSHYACTANLISAHAQDVQITLTQRGHALPTLVLSLQPVSGEKSWIHAQLNGESDTSARIAASRWLERLRRHLEDAA